MKYVLTVLLSVAVLNTSSASAEGICDRALKASWNGIKAAGLAVGNYSVDVYKTKGGRLAVTEAKQGRGQSLPYAGFIEPAATYYANTWRITKPFKQLFQFIPRRLIGLIRGERGHWNDCLKGDPQYVLTLGQGLTHCLLDRPIYRSSEFLNLNKKYVASLPLIFGIMGGAGIWAGVEYNEYLEQSVEAAEETHVKDFRQTYLDLIRYDVRFRLIKETFRKDKNEASALLKAQELNESNRSLLDLSVDDFDFNEAGAKELVRYPQFKHLSKWVKTNYGGDELWKDLVMLNLTYQHLFPYLPQIINGDVKFESDLNQNPQVKAFLVEVFESDFLAVVRRHVKSGGLTRTEAAGLLSEWMRYRILSAELKLMKHEKAGTIDFTLLEQQLLASGLTEKSRWDLPAK